MSPGKYRQIGKHTQFEMKKNEEQGSGMYQVEIRNIEEASALTCAHKGSYMAISRAFDQLFGYLATHNLMQPGMRMVAFYYDDPEAVPELELRSRAGVVFPDPPRMESPFEWTHMPGGSHAVLRHKGPYSELMGAYRWLYGQWLPNSGREAANAPVFEEYLNTPRDTAPSELLTDICLPLK
jgi:AraC family transcriptional regulator